LSAANPHAHDVARLPKKCAGNQTHLHSDFLRWVPATSCVLCVCVRSRACVCAHVHVCVCVCVCVCDTSRVGKHQGKSNSVPTGPHGISVMVGVAVEAVLLSLALPTLLSGSNVYENTHATPYLSYFSATSDHCLPPRTHRCGMVKKLIFEFWPVK
jgi:hypothetical protein